MKTTYSVPVLLDQASLSAFQWRIFLLCFIVAIFDGFDTQSIAYTGPALMEAFQLNAGALAPVMSAGTVGMAIGAMTLGLFGDRLGRRPGIMFSVLLFGIATWLTAYAQSVNQIVILRFLAGLGMGGATPLLLALASEYGPARHRGAIVTGVLLGLPAGAIVGGLLAAKMLPVIGWQGIFVVGGVAPLIVLVFLFFMLPESMQLQVNTGRNLDRVRNTLRKITKKTIPADAQLEVPEIKVEKASLSALFGKELARNTVAIWITYFFNWVAWFMLLSWLPTVLKAGGLVPESAPMGTVVVNAVFILCAIPLSILLPRLNTRNVLLFMFAVGIALSLGLGLALPNWTIVFILVGIAGFGIGGQQLALNYLVISAYPTTLRATATGWAIGIGRTGAIVGAAIGGYVLEWIGPSGFFSLLALPLVLAAVAVVLIKKPAEKTAEPELAAA